MSDTSEIWAKLTALSVGALGAVTAKLWHSHSEGIERNRSSIEKLVLVQDQIKSQMAAGFSSVIERVHSQHVELIRAVADATKEAAIAAAVAAAEKRNL